MTVRPEFESQASGLLFPEIREILHTAPSELPEVTEELHPADLADLVSKLEEDEVGIFFSNLPVDRAADVAEYVEETLRAHLVTALDPDRAARIVSAMSPDDRADVLADMEPEPAAAILARIALPQRRETQLLLQYEANTAGGIMTTQFVTLPLATRADHALALVKAAAQEKETIYTIFVIDRDQKLTGVVSLRELLVADAVQRLADIMNESVVWVTPETDQEEVARLISKYDILALPVVDEGRSMLGVVTVDDVIDVLVAEGTEDVQRMSAVSPIEEPYLVAGFWHVMRNRVVWLVVLFLGELLTMNALQHYEDAFKAMSVLVLFIPLIISTGGNSGSQTATLIIRALATGELKTGEYLRVLGRELMMGVALGVTLGGIGFIRAIVFPGADNPDPVGVAAVVAFTIVAVVINGCVIGSLFPLLLKKLRLDPALMSAPFIASLIDVMGIVVYFNIAQLLLRL
ncbi:MAG TPA: magnesium transporter [Candidatus Eisenbacteria bacterium]